MPRQPGERCTSRASPLRSELLNVRQIALTAQNAFYEGWFRVSTRGTYGFAPGDWSRRERIYYGTLPYRDIFCIIDSLALNRSDVLVDLGCGKGRVVCCASLYNLSQAIGVEVVSELCEIATDNLRRMRRKRARSEIINIGATEFDYTVGTVFYLFHPFGPNTMRSVLLRLGSGLRERQRFGR